MRWRRPCRPSSGASTRPASWSPPSCAVRGWLALRRRGRADADGSDQVRLGACAGREPDEMSGYTVQNLRQVEDQAPKFGMPPGLEARFARTPLEGDTLGLSLMR